MARFVDKCGLRPKRALRSMEEGYAPERLASGRAIATRT
jgi:hypothetical protein